MKSNIISKHFENKHVIWFQDQNEYLVVEPIVAEILSFLQQDIHKSDIVNQLTKDISITTQQALSLVNDVEVLLNSSINSPETTQVTPTPKPTVFNIVKYYKINDLFFLVKYATEADTFLIHPKFAHLETQNPTITHHTFEVYSDDKTISFSVNNNRIGSWSLRETHYFQGKFSMELIQKIHQKKEEDWIGTFHASAVGYNNNAVLFLGDSGNGKSTSLALLQANGFTCLADDFVPIAKSLNVYSFPSAISIKKNSLKTLLPIYPELKTSAEYQLKKLNKTVRYLPTNNNDFSLNLPCKALVFIKYKKDCELEINQISSISAFEQLIPDSWISSKPENVATFLHWFKTLPCYQLTYSNNEKMIATVKKLFANEL